jgi:CoA-transferase family III
MATRGRAARRLTNMRSCSRIGTEARAQLYQGTEKMAGALDGLVVVDLTSQLSGPYAAMMLADHGAAVLKIARSCGDLDFFQLLTVIANAALYN